MPQTGAFLLKKLTPIPKLAKNKLRIFSQAKNAAPLGAATEQVNSGRAGLFVHPGI